MNIPKVVAELPSAPEGVREWILKEVVAGRYMIYSYKRDRAVCTYCGKVFRPSYGEIIPLPKNNEPVTCPCCGSKAIYKALGIGRKSLTEKTRVLVLTKRGNNIYISLTEVDISFENEMPEIFTWIQAVYRLNAKEQFYYKHHPGWCFGCERWEPMKNFKLTSYSYTGYFQPKRQGVYIYTDNFKNIFKNTDLRYSDAEQELKRHDMSAEEFLRYLYLSVKFPAIEVLRKTGFWHLVSARIHEYAGLRALNWNGKDLRSVMKMDMDRIREVRETGISLATLQVYKAYLKKGEPISPKAAEMISLAYETEEIEKFTTLGKAAMYMDKQNRKYSQHNTLRDYSDYIKQCQRLGLDLTQKKILWPARFNEEHARLTKLIDEMKDEIDREAFKRNQFLITGMTEPYYNLGLVIRPAESQSELRNEGTCLNHCVGGYGERIVRGQTSILFIRRADKPEQPYYTLELNKDKKMVQCRGKSNCNMTEEVKAFVDEWMETIVKGKKKGKVA